jgi:hypothetical protein
MRHQINALKEKVQEATVEYNGFIDEYHGEEAEAASGNA